MKTPAEGDLRVLVMLLLGLTFAAGITALWFGAPALADVVFARRAGSVGSLVRGGELVFGLGASIFGVMFVGIACAGAYAMTRRVNPAQEDRPSPQGPYASGVRGTPCSDLRAHTSFHEDSVRLCGKQFAIIGSANTNQRGWTHDSEICAGIYHESTSDHASYSFGHRLRVALWAEHLNMNTADGHAQLADGVASAANWLLPGGNVDVFAENVGRDSGFRQLAPLLFVDPDGS